MGEKKGKNNLCTILYYLCSWKYMEEYCEKNYFENVVPSLTLCSWRWKFTSLKLGKALGQSLCFWCNGSSLLWLNLICNSANLFTISPQNQAPFKLKMFESRVISSSDTFDHCKLEYAANILYNNDIDTCVSGPKMYPISLLLLRECWIFLKLLS